MHPRLNHSSRPIPTPRPLPQIPHFNPHPIHAKLPHRQKAPALTQNRSIFISAVSGEFREARKSVASALRLPGNDVREQSDFGADPNGETLLDKIRNYIADCDLVVCMIGERSGAKPTQIEAAAYQCKTACKPFQIPGVNSVQ